jgi:hypothetical protein
MTSVVFSPDTSVITETVLVVLELIATYYYLKGLLNFILEAVKFLSNILSRVCGLVNGFIEHLYT